MQISVSGQQIDVGASLREHVEERLEREVSKYFEQAIDARVVFTKEAHLFVADIIVNEGTGTGIVIKGNGKAGDIYAAFDQASERIEKQLRRYKRRIKDHHKANPAEMGDAVQPVSGTKYIFSDEGEESAEAEDNPIIIAEKPMQIERLSVSDAVMRMNLANLPALMFINKKSGGISVVYRRDDGNISWVDSQLKASSGDNGEQAA